MLIAQISDLHIKRPGRLAYQLVDTAACLRLCIDHLNRQTPRPDAVLITGDLVDFGEREEYLHLRELLAPLTMPYYLLVGNHDDRAALRDVFSDHTYLQQQPEFIQYTVELGALRVIALDTQNPPHGDGRLCSARRAWLARQLQTLAPRPTLLAMHHPPFACGIAHMDAQRLAPADAAQLAGIVAAHPEVERVLCGHVHRPVQARFGGSIASICPSPAHQVALDLSADGPSRFVLEPAAYQMHRYIAGTGIITHTAYVGDYGPPHPFYDADNALLD